MRPPSERFLPGTARLAFAAALLLVLWQIWPLIGPSNAAERAAPRAVTPRGELTADEKNCFCSAL